MSDWRLQEVVDEHSLNDPLIVQQIIGLIKGHSQFGSPMTPTLRDDEEYHSFQNTGIGGSLAAIDKDGNRVFFAASAPTTPAPTLTPGNPTIILYGPNGQPLLTTESTATVKNKTFAAGGGNHIDASQVDSGVLDIARIPQRIKYGIISEASFEDLPNGANRITYDTLVAQTTGSAIWASGNPTRLQVNAVGLWVFFCHWALDHTRQTEGYAQCFFRRNGDSGTDTPSLSKCGFPDSAGTGNSGNQHRMGATTVWLHYSSTTTDYVQAYLDVHKGGGAGNNHRLTAGSRFGVIHLGS